MSIFIGNNRFLDDLLDVFISSFNNPIHLCPVRRQIMMDNLKFFINFCHHLVIQIRAVVSDKPAWHTIPTYKIVLDKAYYRLLGEIRIGSCFHLFGEVVNCHQDETMFI